MEPASMLPEIDSSIYTYKWQLLQDQFHNRCFINQRIHISFLSYYTMFMISWLLLSASSAQQMYKCICKFIIDIYVYLQEMHIYICIILYIDEHSCEKFGPSCEIAKVSTTLLLYIWHIDTSYYILFTTRLP